MILNLDLVIVNKPSFPRVRKAVAWLDDVAKAFWTRHRDRRRYGRYPQGSSFEARRHVFAKASIEARKDLGL
jgi:hypothetical protein